MTPKITTGWTTLYPTIRGQWTAASGHGTWAGFIPETRQLLPADPTEDVALPALRAAARQGDLIAYRVGRRAVVRTAGSYVKVVRPKRQADLVERHMFLANNTSHLVTPRVIDAASDGRIELSSVPGKSLHAVLRNDSESTVLGTIDVIANQLSSLYSTPVLGGDAPRWLKPNTPADPRRGVHMVARMWPDLGAVLAPIADALPTLSARSDVVVHGDLHDKNVFVDGARLGLIDLDGLCVGSAEDDVANLAVHLQLRALQAGLGDDVGSLRSARLRCGYEQHSCIDAARWRAVERHTWFRLACLYLFRQRSNALVGELLGRSCGDQRKSQHNLGAAKVALAKLEGALGSIGQPARDVEAESG